MTNAVIYARFSSDNQREESIEAQVFAINEFAKKEGYNILRTYADEGISGTTDRRPQFQRMVSDSKMGFFNVVLVHKLDRFARNRADSVIYKKLLAENNVKVISVAESFIADNPFGVVMEGMLEGWAEYYSKNLSREVKKGQDANIRKYDQIGKVKHNGGKPPFGFDVTKEGFYIVNEHEAIAVKKIFDIYLQGHTYSKCIEWLNEHGYKTKYTNTFNKRSINTLLNNVKYIGIYTYRNKIRVMQNGRYIDIDNPNKIVIEGGIPSIVDKSTFYKVQDIMTYNQQSFRSHKARKNYLLSGYLYCGYCDSKMNGNSYKGGRNQSHEYVEYYCSGKKKGICKKKSINKIKLELEVCNIMEKELFSESKVDYLSEEIYKAYVAKKGTTDKNITAYVNKLKSVNAKINNILEAVAEGMFHISMKQKLTDLENHRDILTAQIQKEKAQTELLISKEEVKAILFMGQGLYNKSDEEKRLIFKTFLDNVKLFDDHIQVTVKVDMAVEHGGEGN